jgi:carbamoyltransferase
MPVRKTSGSGAAAGAVAVLGVSGYYHDSAAALVVDGEVIAAAQEERFSRIKHDPSFPEQAAWSVLEAGGIAPGALTAVVFYESPFAKFERVLATQSIGRPRGGLHFARSMVSLFPGKMRIGADVRRVLGVDVPLHFGDHHLSHAASAFLASPYEDAAILTVDGVGEWTTTSIGKGFGGTVELLEHVEYPNSLGLFYSAFTAYCGFRVNSGEYKLMGLAPYGDPVASSALAARITEEIIHLGADGSFALNPTHFGYHTGERTFTTSFAAVLGGPPRSEDEPLLQRHADVAAAVQRVLNDAVLGLARRAHALTGANRLCMAGGVALNVTANSFVAENGPFDEIWVQPAAGDAGGALGAALWASHDVYGLPRRSVPTDLMKGALLGPVPTGCAETLSAYGLSCEVLDDASAATRVAGLLADGLVVGVARGPMEYGPRALGNRSILADPRVPGMQRRLNLATKFREGFRPFAPAVPVEKADAWFEMDGSSPYMLRTFRVLGASAVQVFTDWSERLASVAGPVPAVTHVDLSARVQTVDRSVNPGLHEILTAFEDLTGCPVLVNTSFNVRGEPIVCSAEDAVRAFLRMNLDALLLGNCLVRRSEQSSEALGRSVPTIEGWD